MLLRHVDNRSVLSSILSSWHPLGPALLRTIVDICPSPSIAIDRARAQYMLFGEISTSGGIVELEEKSDESNVKRSTAPEVKTDDRCDNGNSSEEERDCDENGAISAINGNKCLMTYLRDIFISFLNEKYTFYIHCSLI